MQIIYHGSYCQIVKPEIKEGKYTKDFGDGNKHNYDIEEI